jgi:hypothetical protein
MPPQQLNDYPLMLVVDEILPGCLRDENYEKVTAMAHNSEPVDVLPNSADA